jgi:riboflavin biosynthesis pyrimidine reductase
VDVDPDTKVGSARVSQEEPRFTVLTPRGGELAAAQLLDDMFASLRVPGELPFTLANFVMSLDGRAAFRGRSAPLTDRGDRALFHHLRERVDAVLAGPGTLASEPYGPIVPAAARRERRRARGLCEQPLLCTITRSGQLPVERLALLASAQARLVVFSALPLALPPAAASVEVIEVRPPERLTPRHVLATLRERHGVRTLLCEGGPTLFGALLRAGLVDELFLTIAPLLTGGGREPAISAGPAAPRLLDARLRWLLEHEGTLYARYALGHDD